jgi:hypothetical protein
VSFHIFTLQLSDNETCAGWENPFLFPEEMTNNDHLSSLPFFEEIFMQSNIQVNVFGIPTAPEKTSEIVSQEVYEAIAHLLYTHNDLVMTAYRIYNLTDDSWMIILIRMETANCPHQAKIDHILSQAHAQSRMIPPQYLQPLVQRFLTTQTQMHLNRTVLRNVDNYGQSQNHLVRFLLQRGQFHCARLLSPSQRSPLHQALAFGGTRRSMVDPLHGFFHHVVKK